MAVDDGKRGKRHSLMVVIWRFQQSQMIIGILFYTLTLTLVSYPYISPLFDRLGIDPGLLALRLGILFSIVLLFIIVLGIVYDKVFRLWRDQMIVAMERNPYAQEKMSLNQMVQLELLYIPVLEDIDERRGKGPVLSRRAKAWVQMNKELDSRMKDDFERLTKNLDQRADRSQDGR